MTQALPTKGAAPMPYVPPSANGHVRVAVGGPDAIAFTVRAPGAPISSSSVGGIAAELDETALAPASMRYDASSGQYRALPASLPPSSSLSPAFPLPLPVRPAVPPKGSGPWVARVLILVVIAMTVLLLMLVPLLLRRQRAAPLGAPLASPPRSQTR